MSSFIDSVALELEWKCQSSKVMDTRLACRKHTNLSMNKVE